MKFINKIKFAKTELDKDFEIFLVQMVALKALFARITIHFSLKTQIAALQQDEPLIELLAKY